MKISTARLETFSDCVVAIILTIMVLQLRVPDLSGHSSSRELLIYLRGLLPYFATYTFSFMTIGIFWTNHHHLFHFLENTDVRLLWLNFLFMFLLSLIPLATMIVGANPSLPPSAAIYAGTLLLTNAAFFWMRDYSFRHRLLVHGKDKNLTAQISRAARRGRRKSLIGMALRAAAVALAFVNVYAAYACCIVAPALFFIPEEIEEEKIEEQGDKKDDTNV